MTWLFRALGSALAALVVTAGVVLLTFVWLMFSGGPAEGRRTGYFGALFVEVHQTEEGATQLGMGLVDPLPLVVTAVVVTLLVLAVFAVYDALVERRRQLLAGAD